YVMRSRLSLVLALVGFAAIAAESPPIAGKQVAASRASKRIIRRPRAVQAITVTDENFRSIPDIFVAAEQPTVLLFSIPLLKGDKAVLLSAGNEAVFDPAEFSDTYVRLLPRADLPAGTWASLTVALADGNVLTFRLVTDP